jgi:hypothetical protein
MCQLKVLDRQGLTVFDRAIDSWADADAAAAESMAAMQISLARRAYVFFACRTACESDRKPSNCN